MAKVNTIHAVTLEGSHATIGLVELCQQYGVEEAILFEFLEYGLIEEISTPDRNLSFQVGHLQRILTAYRLHKDLEINPNGVILALELMDDLTELRDEVEMLRRHIDSP